LDGPCGSWAGIIPVAQATFPSSNPFLTRNRTMPSPATSWTSELRTTTSVAFKVAGVFPSAPRGQWRVPSVYDDAGPLAGVVGGDSVKDDVLETLFGTSSQDCHETRPLVLRTARDAAHHQVGDSEVTQDPGVPADEEAVRSASDQLEVSAHASLAG
jgi:hypothetical protein